MGINNRDVRILVRFSNTANVKNSVLIFEINKNDLIVLNLNFVLILLRGGVTDGSFRRCRRKAKEHMTT